jgi:hypothetical protein
MGALFDGAKKIKITPEMYKRFNEEMKRVKRESILRQAKSELAASKIILNA